MPALVSELTRRYKMAIFDDETLKLLKQLDRAIDQPRSTPNLRDATWLKARCLVSELWDYWGQLEKAQRAVAAAASLCEPQFSIRNTGKDEVEVLREQVRFALVYARVHYYRQGKYGRAEALMTQCKELIQSLATAEFPCHGTLGQINYYLGCSYRQLGEYERAEESYREAMSCYLKRAQHRQRKLCVPRNASPAVRKQINEKLHEELLFARHRAALCNGLGLGWTAYNRGTLHKALTENVNPALVVLLETKDPLHTAYLQLIQGSILRCKAGRKNLEALNIALTSVTDALRVFEGRHRGNALRAYHERAICSLYAEDFISARRAISDATKLAGNSSEWLGKLAAIESRIERQDPRGSLEKALGLANEAVKEAAKAEGGSGLIEALIARGEVYRKTDDFENAGRDFEKALELLDKPGARNPKTEAIVSLHMALNYLRAGLTSKAEKCWQRWLSVEHLVEHEFVRQTAERYKKERESGEKDFNVSWQTWAGMQNGKEKAYEYHHKRLKHWLFDRAKYDSDSASLMADKLGIDKASVYRWARELKLQTPRRT